MRIRDAAFEDLPAIGKIWNHYVRASTYSWRDEEYSDEALRKWFVAHRTPERPILLAEQEGSVVGFAALSPLHTSSEYRHIAENTIYLSLEALGKRYGKALMDSLIARAREAGLWHLVAMIDSGNARSIAFHARQGFRLVGELEDISQKDGKVLSCTIMQRRLI